VALLPAPRFPLSECTPAIASLALVTYRGLANITPDGLPSLVAFRQQHKGS
jgi:hypothetical protein